ncbi:MAG: toll/interleukin-1 receptor domain-containing protein [Defluviitaleaceae bacterium]|nr:toll/interleukin-1 receptor domain-containing protein [Defluviitaleaceae bacterium]
MDNPLEYGAIICVDGPHKGKIGYFYDNAHDCNLCSEDCCSDNCNFEDKDCHDCPEYKTGHGNCPKFAIVYFGDMLLCTNYYMVPIEHCSNVIPMIDLINRIEELRRSIRRAKNNSKKNDLLIELEYVRTQFYEKHILSSISSNKGKILLISHSSKDKEFANCLYADLVEQGHTPWLDDRDIKPGQSIPKEIQKILSRADYILVLLSPNSVTSSWVAAEWESAYWDEIESQKVKLIPLLIEHCDISQLLKTKKYIDFREHYQQSFNYLLKSL